MDELLESIIEQGRRIEAADSRNSNMAVIPCEYENCQFESRCLNCVLNHYVHHWADNYIEEYETADEQVRAQMAGRIETVKLVKDGLTHEDLFPYQKMEHFHEVFWDLKEMYVSSPVPHSCPRCEIGPVRSVLDELDTSSSGGSQSQENQQSSIEPAPEEDIPIANENKKSLTNEAEVNANNSSAVTIETTASDTEEKISTPENLPEEEQEGAESAPDIIELSSTEDPDEGAMRTRSETLADVNLPFTDKVMISIVALYDRTSLGEFNVEIISDFLNELFDCSDAQQKVKTAKGPYFTVPKPGETLSLRQVFLPKCVSEEKWKSTLTQCIFMFEKLQSQLRLPHAEIPDMVKSWRKEWLEVLQATKPIKKKRLRNPSGASLERKRPRLSSPPDRPHVEYEVEPEVNRIKTDSESEDTDISSDLPFETDVPGPSRRRTSNSEPITIDSESPIELDSDSDVEMMETGQEESAPQVCSGSPDKANSKVESVSTNQLPASEASSVSESLKRQKLSPVESGNKINDETERLKNAKTQENSGSDWQTPTLSSSSLEPSTPENTSESIKNPVSAVFPAVESTESVPTEETPSPVDTEPSGSTGQTSSFSRNNIPLSSYQEMAEKKIAIVFGCGGFYWNGIKYMDPRRLPNMSGLYTHFTFICCWCNQSNTFKVGEGHLIHMFMLAHAQCTANILLGLLVNNHNIVMTLTNKIQIGSNTKVQHIDFRGEVNGKYSLVNEILHAFILKGKPSNMAPLPADFQENTFFQYQMHRSYCSICRKHFNTYEESFHWALEYPLKMPASRIGWLTERTNIQTEIRTMTTEDMHEFVKRLKEDEPFRVNRSVYIKLKNLIDAKEIFVSPTLVQDLFCATKQSMTWIEEKLGLTRFTLSNRDQMYKTEQLEQVLIGCQIRQPKEMESRFFKSIDLKLPPRNRQPDFDQRTILIESILKSSFNNNPRPAVCQAPRQAFRQPIMQQRVFQQPAMHRPMLPGPSFRVVQNPTMQRPTSSFARFVTPRNQIIPPPVATQIQLNAPTMTSTPKQNVGRPRVKQIRNNNATEKPMYTPVQSQTAAYQPLLPPQPKPFAKTLDDLKRGLVVEPENVEEENDDCHWVPNLLNPALEWRPKDYWTRRSKRLKRALPAETELEIEDRQKEEHQEYMKIKREIEDPEYSKRTEASLINIKQEFNTSL